MNPVSLYNVRSILCARVCYWHFQILITLIVITSTAVHSVVFDNIVLCFFRFLWSEASSGT